MTKLTIIEPAGGSRVVVSESNTVLFGQPPEVLKSLLLKGVNGFDTLVLTDIREKGGALTNNLEFPLYFFLFFSNGYAENRKLKLVGEEASIGQAMRLLRYTLLGPSASELESWGTESGLKKEWLDVAHSLALKNTEGEVIAVKDFFDIRPFKNGLADLDDLTIQHSGIDKYEVVSVNDRISVDLANDHTLEPPYPVLKDNIPGGLVKLGLEVLGGASGFTPNEPCTGLALCHNGDYILIDAMPFLDQHLFARGISKTQISALFLTHLHDDHCTMFPLMLMPHVVEVITTREIYNMAMEKLSCGLGWSVEAINQHFKLFEIKPDVPVNYYGLMIDPHITVHSIPTVGATFYPAHQDNPRQICVIGDNHNMSVIKELKNNGVVRQETYDTLQRLYSEKFSMLIADGGAGAIHGNPADAIHSKSERVVYVHVDELTNEFNTTFSLAVSGKRYTIIDGDPVLYSSQIQFYLTEWLNQPISSRWLRSLLAESEIRRYNTDDVILVQDAHSSDYVYLMLTGYCEVVQHNGEYLRSIAQLQAGDVVGEMATINGKGVRNASVVSRTPATVCVFSEKNFNAFITGQCMRDKLRDRWALRPVLRSIPCFSDLTSTVLLKISFIGSQVFLKSGESLNCTDGWYLLTGGEIKTKNGTTITYRPTEVNEFGWRPFANQEIDSLEVTTDAQLVFFDRNQFEQTIDQIPQLNYYLRKFRGEQSFQPVDWQLDS